MSKKKDNGGGFADNPFGGYFDFNDDGKEDLFEQVAGLGLINFFTGPDSSGDDEDFDWDDDDDYDDDDDEYQDEYEDEDDDSALGTITVYYHPESERPKSVDLSGLTCERQKNAARFLAGDWTVCFGDPESNRECCRFILEQGESITAAKYLSYENGFLYSQAVKDNFDLPVFPPPMRITSGHMSFRICLLR